VRAALRLPRGILTAVLAVRLVDEADAFLLPGTFEPLRDDLDLTYAQVSGAFVAIAVGAVAGSGLSVLADYRSRRAIAAGGALGFAASLLLIAVADDLAALLVGSFLVGIASTAMVDAAEIALADLAGDRLERQLTTQNLLGAAGDLLGPALVIAVLAAGGSWRVCFAVAAAVTALYGVWLARLPFPPPHEQDEEHTVRAGLASVLRDRRVWLAGAVLLLLGPLDEPLLAFFIAHLEEAEGLSGAGATAIATATIVGQVAGYASLRRRAGRLAVDAAVLAVAVVGMVLAPDPVTATVAALAAGVALARFWTTVQAVVLRLRPTQAGTVKAVTSTIETVGWGLPLVAGAVADTVDVTAGLATYAAIACALALAAAALARSP
jgi:predicted MFS family arabinose efflux permease